MQSDRCPHCNAKMVVYKHQLNKGMVLALLVIHDRGGLIEFYEFNHILTYIQRNNFQNLQYWGLVEKVKDADGSRRRGKWGLTGLGYDFIYGEKKVPIRVQTYRSSTVSQSPETVFINDLSDGPYRRREDYVEDQIPFRGVL